MTKTYTFENLTLEEAEAHAKRPRFSAHLDPLEGLQIEVRLDKAKFQLDDLSFYQKRGTDCSANWSQMGCLSGDTLISINRNKKGYSTPLWKLFRKFNNLPVPREKSWDWIEGNPTFAQCLIENRNRILLNEIEGVFYSGKQFCIKLTFDDGTELTCTPDHPILTPTGFREASTIISGSEVVARGSVFGGTKRRELAAPKSLGDGRFIDKDGYVRVRVPDHPRANRSNHVYEHILVMEKELGRYITSDEHVHHKNDIGHDNDVTNLAVLTDEEHKKLHGRLRAGFEPTTKVLVSVEDIGIIDTYDIQMAQPNSNYVANGIVVHNTRKTTTALWLVEQLRARKVLIVTSKTGKVPYFQCAPACTNLPIYNVTAQTKVLPKGPGIYLAHYNLFTNKSKVAPQIFVREWDVVILDEAHRIKSQKAQCSKLIRRRIKAKYRHTMTGTGSVNAPDDLWPIFNFLEPKRWSSYWTFRNTYCQVVTEYVMMRDRNTGQLRERPYSKVVGVKKRRLKEFRQILADYGPRHMKKEVYPDLQTPIKTRIDVELNPIQRGMYDSLRTQMQLMDQQGQLLLTPTVLSMLTRMRQISVATPVVTNDYFDRDKMRRIFEVRLEEPSSKLDAMMDVLNDTEDQVVIFTQFRDAITLAKKRMDRAGIVYIHMQQEDDDSTRLRKVEAFQQGRAQVFISTLALGSESITLTKASVVIFLDRSWSPAQNEQAISRVYGRGEVREEPVQIINIEANNTVDQKIESTLKHKQRMFDALFN